jgi:hypothetical protein
MVTMHASPRLFVYEIAAPPPGPTCVSLLFHAADDAHSAVPVGSPRPFQTTICALLRFNVFFIIENHIQYLLVYAK